MKVSWLTEPKEHLASYRYRIAIPAFVLSSRHKVSLGETGDVVVVSKHFQTPQEVERLRGLGKAILFDCCDNHFGTDLRDYYLRMLALADFITVPTEAMQEALRAEGFESTVIPDPYEFPWAKPEVRGVKNLLWYGHANNLPPLLDLGARLEGYVIRGITNAPAPSGFIPWSLKAMWDGFQWCDAVIIPQGNDAKQSCKSTNRVVEGIWSGRFVCANPIPAYEQFRDFAYIGDIPEGLEWLKENPDEALRRIEAGQKYIAERFAPVEIGKLWEAALEKSLDYRRGGVHRASPGRPHPENDHLESGGHGSPRC